MGDHLQLFYLVRHGATEANLRKPYLLQGRRTNLPLSQVGRRQAEATQRVLRDRPIHAIFTSPLQRAHQTAHILAEPHGLPVRSLEALSECDVGRWEGLSWDEVRSQDPTLWAAFDADPGTQPYAGGESFQQVQDRVIPALQQLLMDHPVENILVVTHNIVARVIVAHVTQTPISQARRIRQDNGGITILATDAENWKLVTLNSILHLDGFE